MFSSRIHTLGCAAILEPIRLAEGAPSSTVVPSTEEQLILSFHSERPSLNLTSLPNTWTLADV